MEEPLTEEQINTSVAELEGWGYSDDALHKEFKFKNFKEALAFMVRVGLEAELAGHHPNLSNVYNMVTIRLQTHDAGDKVTKKDIQLATAIENI